MEAIDISCPKRRSQAEKIGKHTYELQLEHRILRILEEILVINGRFFKA